jgi:hypothetical protein
LLGEGCKKFFIINLLAVWLPGMDSNHDNHKRCRICNLQCFQWSKMPDWTRKTITRTQLVHGGRTRPA